MGGRSLSYGYIYEKSYDAVLILMCGGAPLIDQVKDAYNMAWSRLWTNKKEQFDGLDQGLIDLVYEVDRLFKEAIEEKITEDNGLSEQLLNLVLLSAKLRCLIK